MEENIDNLDLYKKGDLAQAKAIAKLTELEYDVLIPCSMHLRYDLVIHKNNKFYKIQVKYTSKGDCVERTGQRIASGWVSNYYNKDDFDYYALYLPQIDMVVFPSIKFAGSTISIEPKTNPFWWYEDFLDLTENAHKRIYEEFNEIEKIKLQRENLLKPRIHLRKVERPSKEILEKLVWEKPTTQIAKDYNVSDVAIAKWCKIYNIEKPPRGHWS